MIVVGSIKVMRRMEVSMPTRRKERVSAMYSEGLRRERNGMRAMVANERELWQRILSWGNMCRGG